VRKDSSSDSSSVVRNQRSKDSSSSSSEGGVAGVGGVSEWMGRTRIRVPGYQLLPTACKGPHITSKREVRTRWHCMASPSLVGRRRVDLVVISSVVNIVCSLPYKATHTGLNKQAE